MDGLAGRWVAKLVVRWVAKLEGDGWLSWREMGGQVGSAPACYGNSLGSNPGISQKYNMGDISKGVAKTL